MVEFALPKNSRVGSGKTWPKHGDSKNSHGVPDLSLEPRR